jgi:hypothetical protein
MVNVLGHDFYYKGYSHSPPLSSITNHSCLPPASVSCKATEDGAAYTGTLSMTVTGLPCQRWDHQTPHTHGFTEDGQFPEGSVAEASNYCRCVGIRGDSTGFVGIREDSRGFVGIRGDSWGFEGIRGDSRGFDRIRGAPYTVMSI